MDSLHRFPSSKNFLLAVSSFFSPSCVVFHATSPIYGEAVVFDLVVGRKKTFSSVSPSLMDKNHPSANPSVAPRMSFPLGKPQKFFDEGNFGPGNSKVPPTDERKILKIPVCLVNVPK